MRLKHITTFLLFFLLGARAFSQIGGTGTYDFLQLPVSAHQAAMGGNYVTTREADLGVAAVNPSFLDSNLNRHLILTYVPFLAGIQYGYVAYAQTFKKIGTFDASLKYLDYGSFVQSDASGNITGSFTAGDYMMNIGYGRPVKDSILSVGANLKLIDSHMAQYFSFGAALDLAGSYVTRNRRFAASLVIENIGTQLKHYTPSTPEALPFDINAGISEKVLHAPFRFNLTFQHLQKWDLTYIDPEDSATVNPLTGQVTTKSKLSQFADKLMRHIVPGVEILIGKNFALRVAYDYQRRKELELAGHPGISGISGGFGLKIYKFQMSYALSSYNLSGAASTFTLGFDVSDFVPHKSGTPTDSPISSDNQH